MRSIFDYIISRRSTDWADIRLSQLEVRDRSGWLASRTGATQTGCLTCFAGQLTGGPDSKLESWLKLASLRGPIAQRLDDIFIARRIWKSRSRSSKITRALATIMVKLQGESADCIIEP